MAQPVKVPPAKPDHLSLHTAPCTCTAAGIYPSAHKISKCLNIFLKIKYMHIYLMLLTSSTKIHCKKDATFTD